MRRGEFRKTMQRMYPRDDAGRELSERLEAKVMADYEDWYTQRRWWTAMLSPRNRVARYAFGTLAVVLLTGAACQLPTETPVDMGHHVRLLFVPAGEGTEDASMSDDVASDDVTFEVDVRAVSPGTQDADVVFKGETAVEGSMLRGGVLQSALARVGAEKVEFRMRSIEGQPRGLDLLVWGQHVRRDDVLRVLEQHVGHAKGLSYEVTPLTGHISESVGKRISRVVFDIDVQGENTEELRTAILEQLAARGLVGTVDVQDDGDGRKITIEAGTPDGSRKLAEEVILEQPEN